MEVTYLNVEEALVIYVEIIGASNVLEPDVRDLAALESALAQPRQTFDGKDLYPTIEEKAAALLYSLCNNHPFTDGNKRVAFIAMRTFLRSNGFDVDCETHATIDFVMSVASGDASTEKILDWIRRRMFVDLT